MQVVIEIEDSVYEQIKTHGDVSEFHKIILNGKVLPKGHGRLIDAENLPISSIDITDLPYDDKGLAVVLLEDIEYAEAVIEEDEEDTE